MFRIKIMDRYLAKETYSYFLLGVIAITIMMTVETLFELMELLIDKGVAIDKVLKILIYRLPAFMVVTFPISILAGTELGIGRLLNDSEITAMRASGISLKRITIPFTIVALLVSIGSYALNDFVVPEANHISQNIIREVIYKKGPPHIEKNVFFKDAENRYFYINDFDQKNFIMKDIMVYEIPKQWDKKFPRVITAKEGKWLKDTWDLKDGHIYEYDKEGKIVYSGNFKDMKITVKDELKDFFKSQRTPQEMTSRELARHIRLLKKSGVDPKGFEVDYHMKFSVPFSALLFTLIGAPLGLKFRKGGKATGVVISIVLVFVYYLILSASRALGKSGALPPIPAAWMPNIIFGALGLYLIFTVEK